MSVDTKIKILIQGDCLTTVQAIQKALINAPDFKILGDITFKQSVFADRSTDAKQHHQYDYISINFAIDAFCEAYTDNKEHRTLSLYYDWYDPQIFVSLSLGCWGHNEQIARHLVNTFGGYADYSDCDDIRINYAMPEPKP